MLLLGILVIGIIVLISTDFLRIRIHKGKPRHYTPTCWLCGEPYSGNHWCRGRKH
jgi:hypothetical protein